VKNYTNKFHEGNGKPVLLLSRLTVKFGGLTALEDVDLEVKEKGIKGIIGPIGAGKTTLFNAITGFIKADSGEIQYKGESILGLHPHDIAKKGIIRTFQLSGIFPEMSVLENVMTGYHRLTKTSLLDIILRLRKAKAEERKIKEEALELLKTFNLLGLAQQRTGDLSYGQQRLVEISRALMSGVNLLLLDEPAAGLSSSERQDLNQLLRSISKERSIYILLADHSMDFVMDVCDHITVLNYGKKIAEGSPKEIQQNEEVIEVYLGRR
jgi:branched-chain amino acid transport system ATP-binding protein